MLVPPGNAFVVMLTRECTAMVMVKACCAVCCGECESTTPTVKVVSPETEGVPEIIPVVLLKLKPVGNAPDFRPKEYGVVPPETGTV